MYVLQELVLASQAITSSSSYANGFAVLSFAIAPPFVLTFSFFVPSDAHSSFYGLGFSYFDAALMTGNSGRRGNSEWQHANMWSGSPLHISGGIDFQSNQLHLRVHVSRIS